MFQNGTILTRLCKAAPPNLEQRVGSFRDFSVHLLSLYLLSGFVVAGPRCALLASDLLLYSRSVGAVKAAALGEMMFASWPGKDSSEETPENRLWKAVIARTLQEWISGPRRRQRAAEEFLLRDDRDFPQVCQSAGMDPGRLRAKLLGLKKSIEPKG